MSAPRIENLRWRTFHFTDDSPAHSKAKFFSISVLYISRALKKNLSSGFETSKILILNHIQGNSSGWTSCPKIIRETAPIPQFSSLTKLMFRWLLMAVKLMERLWLPDESSDFAGQQTNWRQQKCLWKKFYWIKFQLTLLPVPQACFLKYSTLAAVGFPLLFRMISISDSQWCKRMHCDWSLLSGSRHDSSSESRFLSFSFPSKFDVYKTITICWATNTSKIF